MDVVKRYVLPIFEKECRTTTDRNRSSLMGLPSPRQLGDFKGSVYGELKLSERLQGSLDELKENFSKQTEAFKDAQQMTAELKADNAKLSRDNSRLLVEVETLHTRLSSTTCEVQSEALKKEEIRSQLSEYRGIVKQLTEEVRTLSEANHIQKALNDKWRNIALILKNENELLHMEITVKAEHLKGLYEAINRVLGFPVLTDKLRYEVEVIRKSFLGSRATLAAASSEVEAALGLKDKAEMHFAEMLVLYKESAGSRDKTLRFLNAKVVQLSANLEIANEERIQLQEDLGELEKRNMLLAKEYDILRSKVKQFNIRRRTEQEEQTCKFCGRVFFESENYSWSCKTHKSDFGGKIWWCCGKEGKDSKGCMLKKHIANRDEDRLIPQSTEKHKPRPCQVSHSQFCREYGHEATACPRDPNPQGNVDNLQVETSRLQSVHRRRIKTKQQADDIKERALAELEQKMFGGAFADSNVTSLSSSVDHGVDGRCYPDVMRWKDQTPFNKAEVRCTQGLYDLDAGVDDIISALFPKKSKKSSTPTMPSSARVRFSLSSDS